MYQYNICKSTSNTQTQWYIRSSVFTNVPHIIRNMTIDNMNPDLHSDHYPIIKNTTHNIYYKFKQATTAQWQSYQQLLDNLIQHMPPIPIYNNHYQLQNCVDQQWQSIKQSMVKSAEICIGTTTTTTTNHRPKWWTPELAILHRKYKKSMTYYNRYKDIHTRKIH